MKYIDIDKEWHCKEGSGLFFGIKIIFPISIRLFDPQCTYKCIFIKIGLIVLTVNVTIKYDYWPDYDKFKIV
jgi:hypothetical protein